MPDVAPQPAPRLVGPHLLHIPARQVPLRVRRPLVLQDLVPVRRLARARHPPALRRPRDREADRPGPPRLWQEHFRHPRPDLRRALCRARRRAVLRLPGLLRRPLVPRRVLVLQSLHTLHVDRLRVHHRLPGELVARRQWRARTLTLGGLRSACAPSASSGACRSSRTRSSPAARASGSKSRRTSCFPATSSRSVRSHAAGRLCSS